MKQISSSSITKDSSSDAGRLSRFASNAIGLNRTFAGLKSLLFRTKLLALNAEIASGRIGESGAAFGVVVKDLISMGDMLRKDVSDLEIIFHDIARHVAVWISSGKKFCMYQSVIDSLNIEHDSEEHQPVRDMFILSEHITREYEHQSGWRKSQPALERSWSLLLDCRTEAIKNLLAVEGYCDKLVRFLERLNFTATQQSGFLATTARVEATHANQTEFNLDDVANDIQSLAKDFSSLQHNADDAVRTMRSEAERIASLLKKA